MLNKNGNDPATIDHLKHEMAHRNHQPGYEITHHDGTVYRVSQSGAWQVVKGVRKGAKKRQAL